MTKYTKEYIINLLEKNDKAVGRALMVLLNNQTFDEQQAKDVKYQNGKGFAAPDAFIGTSMAIQAKARGGLLSPKQVSYWRKKNKTGAMRIGKYWKQLVIAAEAKNG